MRTTPTLPRDVATSLSAIPNHVPPGSTRRLRRREEQSERDLPLPLRSARERRPQPRLRLRDYGGPPHERPRVRDGRQFHDHRPEADRIGGPREARHEQDARGPPAPGHPEHGVVQATFPALRDEVLHDPPELQGPRGLDRAAAASVPTGPRLAP